MIAALVCACVLLHLLAAAPIGDLDDDADFSVYNKGIDFTDYGDHQPSTANSEENLFEIHPKGENEPDHIRDHRAHVAAVEENRRALNGQHHGADFLFLSPTSGGIHNPSHVLDPASPTVRELQDRTWQRANSHNPWFRIAWPQSATGGREPTRLGYDYKKGGYSWGGYGTFGAIDIWEEQEEESSEDDVKNDEEDDPFDATADSVKDQRSSIKDHLPSSIVPPLLPILDHEKSKFSQ